MNNKMDFQCHILVCFILKTNSEAGRSWSYFERYNRKRSALALIVSSISETEGGPCTLEVSDGSGFSSRFVLSGQTWGTGGKWRLTSRSPGARRVADMKRPLRPLTAQTLGSSAPFLSGSTILDVSDGAHPLAQGKEGHRGLRRSVVQSWHQAPRTSLHLLHPVMNPCDTWAYAQLESVRSGVGFP